MNNNQETRGAWGLFSEHRQRVMKLIQHARGEKASSIAVLGAGNCNDLDLSWLADAFPAVHLFDLDAEALANGITGQGLAQSRNIHRHAPVDLTSSLHRLVPFLERSPTRDEFEALLHMLQAAPLPIPGAPHDLVVSDCVLSQMISTLTQLKLIPDQLIALTLAMRSYHLRALAVSTKPGGCILFVTDLVSSNTLPELPGLQEFEWLPALRRCLGAGNFFTGLNPEMVSMELKTDPFLREHLTYQRFIAPWRWDMSETRSYLVYAFLIGVATG